MKPVTKLLRWYARYGRDLPWRNTTDPYKILVSEIMLQQTQVPRVIVFFQKWLKEYPDWNALADASNAAVIKSWAGLGYNRRALMLRDIARQVVKTGVPKSEEEWVKLKGIGPYTAAALTVFSLRKRALPVDTNIRRSVGRLFLQKPYAQLEDDDTIRQAMSAELMSVRKFYDVPQALFDLATQHCTKVPDCASCPMKNACSMSGAFLAGEVEAPKRMTKKVHEKLHRNKKHPDRIYRGRIVTLVRKEIKVDMDSVGSRVDESFDTRLDEDWIHNMIDRLVKDGMLERSKNVLTLSDL